MRLPGKPPSHLVRATVSVARPPAEVFAFLSDLRNHWRLTGRWVKVHELAGPPQAPRGATVELRAPLRIRRRLRTEVHDADPHGLITGVAELSPSTAARVTWTIRAADSLTDGTCEASEVTLTATLTSCGKLDRVLLACGGRAWLARRFRATMRQLAGHLTPAPALPPAAQAARAAPAPAHTQ